MFGYLNKYFTGYEHRSLDNNNNIKAFSCDLCKIILYSNETNVDKYYSHGKPKYICRNCHNSKICNGCNKSVNNKKAIKDHIGLWHYRCYPYNNCEKCFEPVDEFDRIVDYNKVWHKHCVKKDKCNACSKIVFNDKGIRFDDMIYHYRCISCKKCGLSYKDGETEFNFDNGVNHVMCGINVCRLCDKPWKKESLTKTHNSNVHTYCYNIITHQNLKDKPICSQCKKQKIIIQNFWPENWSTQTHKKFPYEFRMAVRTLLLIINRFKFSYKFPKDIIFLIIKSLCKPTAWKYYNTIDISKLCTEYRCVTYYNECSRCNNPIRVTEYDTDYCRLYYCNYYKNVCHLCKMKVRHNSNPEHVCTLYRCITQTCKYCDGKIRHAKDNQLELCSLEKCNVYYHNICKCKQLIMINPSSPLNQCTIYRCINDRCFECFGNIRPYSNYDSLCDKHMCLIKENLRNISLNKISEILKINHTSYFGKETHKQKKLLIKNLILTKFDTFTKNEIEQLGLLISLL